MDFYLIIILVSSIGIVLLLMLLYLENKVVNAKEKAFSAGESLIGMNIKNSISMPISQDLGFTLIKDANGNKIIIGNGYCFLLEQCIFS